MSGFDCLYTGGGDPIVTGESKMTTIQLGLFEVNFKPSTFGIDGHVCANCGEAFDGNIYKNPDGNDICEGCFDVAGYVECECCGAIVGVSDSNTVYTSERWGLLSGDEMWCDSCADSHATRCDNCGELVTTAESVGTDSICGRCLSEDYFTCAGCGEFHHNDDCVVCRDVCYCNDCGHSNDVADFSARGWKSDGCITETGSARKFGVEIETSECGGGAALANHGAWAAKEDCSISGKEFVSVVLSGDSGLQAIRDFSDFAADHDFEVDNDCGLHIHLDLRSESDESKWAAAYAYAITERLWFSFVNRDRHDNQYCQSISWDSTDCIDLARAGVEYASWVFRISRYHWVNVAAYYRHKTIEIRLHHATCDEEEICNWIKAHVRFIDWAVTIGLDGLTEKLTGKTVAEQFEVITREAWQDDTLASFYAERSNRAGNPVKSLHAV